MPRRSTHGQILDGIKATIETLNLDGLGLPAATPLPASQVIVRNLTADRNLASLPAVLITLVPTAEKTWPESTRQDWWTYPAQVTIVAASNQSLLLEDDGLYWREKIATAFAHQRPAPLLAAVSKNIVWIEVEPATLIDQSAWRDANLFVSAFVVWVRTGHTR